MRHFVDPRSVGMPASEVDPSKIRDIRPEVLDQDGRLRVLPASYWSTTTQDERQLLGHRSACYLFPTEELVERLREIIDGQPAIEIGSGNGVLAEALGIMATDSFQQAKPKFALMYRLLGQPTITYGPNVQEMHASRAVRRLNPDVVVGGWVTHKWDPRHPEAEGNEDGIDMGDLLRHCKRFVLIGNEHVHRNNPLWGRPYEIEYPDYLYSRKTNETRDFIAIWPGGKS